MAEAVEAEPGVVVRRGPRRRHAIAEKLAIIRECLEPGASLAGVALAHRVNANMVRKWVVKYQCGGYGQFRDGAAALLPVVIKPRGASRLTPSRRTRTLATVEVELRKGVLRVHGADRDLLAALIAALSI